MFFEYQKLGGMIMFCKYCGKELKKESMFCPNCESTLLKESGTIFKQLRWRELRILGIAITLIATWLPCISYGNINFAEGRLETFSGSLWKFYTTEIESGTSIYIGLICMCMSIFFTILNKNVFSIVCWVFGISPYYDIISLASLSNIKIRIGAYITIVGWILVVVSILIRKISVIREKAIQKGDSLMAASAVGIGCCRGALLLGIFSILTCVVPLSVFSLSIAGVVSGIVGMRGVNKASASAIVGIVLSVIALLFAVLVIVAR